MRNKPITIDEAFERFIEKCEVLIEDHYEQMLELGIDADGLRADVIALRRKFLAEQTARAK